MKDELFEFPTLTGTGRPIIGLAPAYYSHISPSQSSATMNGTLCLTASQAAWVFEAAKKLQAMGRLRPGWDSHSGRALGPNARELTVRVLGWLGMDELPVPAVVLGSGGEVHLEWRAKGRELNVELGEGRGISFIKVFPSGEMQEGGEASAMPDKLRELSGWLLHG